MKKTERFFEWEYICVKWSQLLVECLGHTMLSPKETEVGSLNTGRMLPIMHIPKNVGIFISFFCEFNQILYCTC